MSPKENLYFDLDSADKEWEYYSHHLFKAPYSKWNSEQILRYFQKRQSVSYFPVVDTIETQRDKIDKILNGYFEFNSETYQLSDPIHWTKNPSSDIEWLILLHKFYYAVGLGMAFQESSDPAYAQAWIRLTESWIDSAPLDLLSSDVTGRRIQNWIFAHHFFIRNQIPACLNASFYLKFLISLNEQVAHLCQHLTVARNHRTLELCAIFLAAVVFPEFRKSEEWLEFARNELSKNAESDFLSDGVHCELSTDYHHLVLKNFLWIKRLSQLNGICLPEIIDHQIRKALEFSMFVHKPDGRIPSLSDGDSRSFLDLLEQGYHLYPDEALRYVVSQGRSGIPPQPRSRAFSQSGYYVIRSGWGQRADCFRDQRYMVIDCGPLGAGNHGHFDLLNIEMAAFGQSLIVDPGRYTYDESGDPNWRVHFRHTSAHNTVLVDGKNQTRYVQGKRKYKIKGPEPLHEVKSFITGTGFDFFQGVAKSHEYPVIHERSIFFICQENSPQYWIISDRLVAKEPHRYDLRFHLSNDAQGKVELGYDNHAVIANSPHLLLAQPLSQNISPSIEQGFLSDSYGIKHPAPVIQFNQSASTACFHSVLLPYRRSRPGLNVQAMPIISNAGSCADHAASCIRIRISEADWMVDDVYFLNHLEDDRQYCFMNHAITGKVFFRRNDQSGKTLFERIIPAGHGGILTKLNGGPND